MRAGLLFFLFVFSALGAGADSFKGFIKIDSLRSLYVDWHQGASDKPVVILLNGLTYETPDWDSFVTQLAPYGYSILRYDPRGMGQTLAKEGGVSEPIAVEDQARDLDLLTKKLGLAGPLNLLGLSYGGGVAIAFAAAYPERVHQAILLSPFTEPVASQDAWIKNQIAMTRTLFPLNPATDDELYVYFLRLNVYTIFPLTEPSMLASPLKPEAVFQMTQGVRAYDMLAASRNFPARSVHLVTASEDQYIRQPVFAAFWAQLPKAARASWLSIDFSEHKIPEAFPLFAAAWVDRILSEKTGMDKGARFSGNPLTGAVKRQ